MSTPATARQVAWLPSAFVVGAVLAACGHSAPQNSMSLPVAQLPPAPSGDRYDISRVDNVKNDFPPGFTVRAGLAKTLGQQDVESTGINILTEARLDPPQCLPAIIPPNADLTVGTKAAGVAASGDQGGVHVTALRLPKPVPLGPPPAGCDRVTISGSPKASGTAERIPAPHIDGATTTGVKLVATEPEDPHYIFTAALDDETTVVVRGCLDAALDPPQFLSNLLVKGVAEVRGH